MPFLAFSNAFDLFFALFSSFKLFSLIYALFGSFDSLLISFSGAYKSSKKQKRALKSKIKSKIRSSNEQNTFSEWFSVMNVGKTIVLTHICFKDSTNAFILKGCRTFKSHITVLNHNLGTTFPSLVTFHHFREPPFKGFSPGRKVLSPVATQLSDTIDNIYPSQVHL